MPTLPGPTSQTPLLQAKCDVTSVGGAGVAAAADAAAARLAATSDPVISSTLSGERMTTSPGRGKTAGVRAGRGGGSARRGPAEIPIRYVIRSGRADGSRARRKLAL